MAKSTVIPQVNLTTRHEWLVNQLNQRKESTFLNLEKSIKAYEKLMSDNQDVIDEELIINFTKRRLTAVGKKRLSTTLRVAKLRKKKKGFLLQTTLTPESKSKLNQLTTALGMGKSDLINKLIETADIKVTLKTEEYCEPKSGLSATSTEKVNKN